VVLEDGVSTGKPLLDKFLYFYITHFNAFLTCSSAPASVLMKRFRRYLLRLTSSDNTEPEQGASSETKPLIAEDFPETPLVDEYYPAAINGPCYLLNPGVNVAKKTDNT